MRLQLRFAVVLLIAAASLASAQDKPAVPAVSQNGAANPDDYRIGAEDVLQIIVWKNETLSRSVAVRPDGKISFPLLDDVPAAGHTPSELRDFLAKRLSDYIAAPEVSVIVSEVRSMKVSVIGEVPKPGRYELKSRTTVLDVLALAGGFSQFASRSRIVVLRPEAGKMKRMPFNYNRVISAGGEEENFYLLPGDIVVVP
jgi:polysaccharide export outer membrane protein